MNIRYAAALLATAIATPAMAQDADNGSTVSVALTGGTLGIGPELGWRPSERIGVRGSATFVGIGADFDSDDLAYEGDVKLNSFGAMLDVYPFGGAFRISGGARINNNTIDVTSTPSGIVEIGGDEYTAAEVGTLSSGADFKRFSPAVTIGFGGSNRKGFVFSADAGVLFQGAARLRPIQATGTARDDADFMASLEAERVSLQDDVDKVKVFPILQFGLGYRF
ncbi:hypothetical protein GRI97_11120 [Altererythrobacter xixiisoli]|uniref:Outer membrane protein beta-barrel domain-containing protein n=1 Tax=Croceibacterium xixiisoli TaxID=1476466 RepID=A0A6I4TY17_9SPHN|nr:hypothetical protein [Croceibacterium xixiisoli]MXO99538.1 hypothetical protein [Croceibacterium xixiisoli]